MTVDLFKFIDRGVQRTGGTEADKTAELARQHWLGKLLADETRAWWNVGQADRSAIKGLLVLLTLAGLTHTYDKRNDDTPEIRVIRGAISALEQCMRRGDVIRREDAGAISSACNHAREILKVASLGAIQHAAVYMDKVTK